MAIPLRVWTNEFDRIINTPGASTDHTRDLTGTHPKNQPMRGMPWQFTPPNKEPEMKTKLDDAIDTTEIDQLCEDMNAAFSESPCVVTLRGPETLTVETAKGYSKTPHIGGEDFRPSSAYVGKRKTIIVKFAPVDAQAYQFMEMEAKQAMGKLSGFDTYCNDPDHRIDLASRLRAINTLASNEREREAVKDKFTLYDNFGTF